MDVESSVDGSLQGSMIFIHQQRPYEEGVLENFEKGV